MTAPGLVEALHRSRLGTELSEEEARALAAHLAFRDLQPGEVLVREGGSDNHLCVIVSGA